MMVGLLLLRGVPVGALVGEQEGGQGIGESLSYLSPEIPQLLFVPVARRCFLILLQKVLRGLVQAQVFDQTAMQFACLVGK